MTVKQEAEEEVMTSAKREFMTEPSVARLLAEYRVPYPPHQVSSSGEVAVRIAQEIGFPVVLKVVSSDIVHKSDCGGVLVGLDGAEGVLVGFASLLQRVREKAPDAAVDGVLVCAQQPPGLEMIVGGLVDSTFGPTVMCGLGGVFTEVFDDVAFRVAPITSLDAEEMLRELRGHALLQGARGGLTLSIASLVDVLVAVSGLMIDHPEIQELDLNPVRVYETSVAVLDARAFVTR